jgi:hypothetical protein
MGVTDRGVASTVFPVVSARDVRQLTTDKIGDFFPDRGPVRRGGDRPMGRNGLWGPQGSGTQRERERGRSGSSLLRRK